MRRFLATIVCCFLGLGAWSCSRTSGSSPSETAFPTCTYESALAEACGCDIDPPLDLAANVGTVSLWPFGVHATTGHTEGHRGLDYISTTGTVTIVAPADGVIHSIDNDQDESGGLATEYDLSDSRVHFTTLDADCGVRISFIPLRLEEDIVAGTRVTKGQVLGELAEMLPPYGPNRWSTHFEIDAKTSTSDTALYAVCPANVFSNSDVAHLTTMLGNSTYTEKTARTVSISCEGGGSTSMSYDAEDQLCNDRLSAGDNATLAACLPNRASIIW